jgi:DNA-binding SARP family transcriptional activator
MGEDMKDHLQARLLGSPELRWQNQTLEFIPPKLCAVLYYLIAQGKRVARSELEHLFWGPGSSDNLRQALHRLRALPGAEHWLHTDPDVHVHSQSDLAHFESALAADQHEQALEVWRGIQPASPDSSVLLHGFRLESAAAFSDWLEVERVRVGLLYLETLERRAFELEQVGAINQALIMVQTLLREDPLNESAYRAAMRLSHRKGQPEMARYYLERCRRVLRQELGTQPLEETLRLGSGSDLTGSVFSPEPHTLRQALEALPDPRASHGQRYPLPAMLGLVLLALLCGGQSLRRICFFAQEHPMVMRGLGFRKQTAPGRSSLTDLLDHLDPVRLQEALDCVASLPVTSRLQQVSALELMFHWTHEVRRGLANEGSTVRLIVLLERLGWPGLKGWVVLSEHRDGTLAVR